MPRHDTLIIKDTHRGLLYEDGAFRDVLPAGRHQIPRPSSPLASFFGARRPRVEVVLVDVRGRERTVVLPELLTVDGVTISASFVVQYRVADPKAAVHLVKNFEERLYAEAQTAARRVLRGLSVEEILGGRDEVGEEMHLQLREAAETFGVDVTSLDFKDLGVPEDLRKVMTRAVLARRARQAQFAEGPALLDDDDALGPAIHHDDAHGLAIAGSRFTRERVATAGALIRQHDPVHRPRALPGPAFAGTPRRRAN